MTERSVLRLIRVCRASVKHPIDDGDHFKQLSSPEPAPYVYRIRQRLLSSDEALSRDKPEAATPNNEHQPHKGGATDSPESSKHSHTDETTVRIMLENSNVSYDAHIGCTIFEKHFVLASALHDLGHEFSENKHFFCVTGHLDWVCYGHARF